MTIRSTQKVIKVGSSLAVTIPARDAQSAGIKAGDNVVSTIDSEEKVLGNQNNEIAAEYEAFKKVYGDTLKNLANR